MKALQHLKFRHFILFCGIMLSVSSCSSLDALISKLPSFDSTPVVVAQKKTIYIQSMVGQNVPDFQAIFFDTIQEQNRFEFVELLPDQQDSLRILRLDIKDYSLWENEELSPTTEENILSLTDQPDKILRRNANISIQVGLFEAESGKRVIDKTFAQPYQQIYIGEKAIKRRPDRVLELNRLTRLAIFRMLSAFNQDEDENMLGQLEKGVSEGWMSKYVRDLGDDRIKKGNRFAVAGEYDQAILVWKLALFQPTIDKTTSVSIRNRATAYYNLGVLYAHQDEWWMASDMFSKANRLNQKTKYAQAWGKSIQTWLDFKKNPVLAQIQKKDKEDAIKSELKQPILLELPRTIKSIEQNDQYLLRPRELWPLEPALIDVKKAFEADY